MILHLVRDNPTGPDCTLGLLSLEDRNWQTLERPWIPDPLYRGGQPHISCVPAGTYQLVRHNTEKHPHTFALVNPELGVVHEPAPGMRSDILIHPANFVHELEGCIAIGKYRRWMNEWSVTASRVAFAELQSALPWVDNEHQLVIT